jgi:hypothetical protein
MSNIGPIASIKTKQQVIQNCWDYVLENFGKFNEANKIKVSLAIICKNIPTELIGDLKGQETKVVVIVKEKEFNADQSQAGRLPASVLVEPK